jgi:hypothetical protein
VVFEVATNTQVLTDTPVYIQAGGQLYTQGTGVLINEVPVLSGFVGPTGPAGPAGGNGANGAAGATGPTGAAPSTAFGAVGTYAYCHYASDLEAGATIAGSSLTCYNNDTTSFTALSGTWQFMGGSGGAPANGLYLRIA